MNIIDLIQKKRDKMELCADEIEFFISELCAGKIPDYQLSAMLMAMFINDLSKSELTALTISMAHSGDMLDLSEIPRPLADKHSTGGIGDKTTLIIMPVLASLGINMAKMSGRGLGITGGTIDKLESIPGFITELPGERFISQIKQIGAAISSQSLTLAPADKIMYAMRDVTATVDNIGLIASSIMSKKLAGGSDIILLDVKCGSGAFMPDIEQARILAETMVEIGNNAGRRTAALITDMNSPLGFNVGNSLEVIEAIEILKGNSTWELLHVCKVLCAYILKLCGRIDNISEADGLIDDVIRSGGALDKLRAIIKMQSGDAMVIDDYNLFDKCDYSYELKAEKDGYIHFINAAAIGNAAICLGAGRRKKDDRIDYGAGIHFCISNFSHVKKGDIIAEYYTNKPKNAAEAEELLESSFEISDISNQQSKHILDVII